MSTEQITRKNKRTNAIALWTIKILAFLAVAILFFILGYLIFRGVYKSKRTESNVIPSHLIEAQGTDPVIVLANRKTNIKYLSWFTLQDMALGKVATLRRISNTDVWMNFYIQDTALQPLATWLGVAVADILSSGAVVADAKEILSVARSDEGAVLILDNAMKLPAGFLRPQIDDLVLAVNPDVTALYGNNRIGTLTSGQFRRLVSGEVSSWSDLHGGPFPVQLITDASAALIASTPGAVGVVSAKEYSEASGTLELLKMERIVRGANLTWAYLTENPVESGKFGGILSIIGNTFIMVLLTVLIAGPVGVAAAIYLVEYAKNGRLTSVIRAGINVLAGIPSIIFGLFGLLVFVQLFGWSFSLISGTLTVALMILPTIIRTSEEAIRSVDRSLREASIGLGATKIETIRKVVLPSAAKGITTGLILAIGRAVGETAALVYTIGSSTELVKSLTSSSRVLSTHIYLTITEGQSFDRAFASALVLIVVVLVINFIAKLVMNANKHTRKQHG